MPKGTRAATHVNFMHIIALDGCGLKKTSDIDKV